MDHDGNLRHLVYNMERVLADPPPRAPLSDQIRPQAVHSMDEENGISKMVVVLDCHNYRHIASAPSAPLSHASKSSARSSTGIRS